MLIDMLIDWNCCMNGTDQDTFWPQRNTYSVRKRHNSFLWIQSPSRVLSKEKYGQQNIQDIQW